MLKPIRRRVCKRPRRLVHERIGELRLLRDEPGSSRIASPREKRRDGTLSPEDGLEDSYVEASGSSRI